MLVLVGGGGGVWGRGGVGSCVVICFRVGVVFVDVALLSPVSGGLLRADVAVDMVDVGVRVAGCVGSCGVGGGVGGGSGGVGVGGVCVGGSVARVVRNSGFRFACHGCVAGVFVDGYVVGPVVVVCSALVASCPCLVLVLVSFVNGLFLVLPVRFAVLLRGGGRFWCCWRALRLCSSRVPSACYIGRLCFLFFSGCHRWLCCRGCGWRWYLSWGYVGVLVAGVVVGGGGWCARAASLVLGAVVGVVVLFGFWRC